MINIRYLLDERFYLYEDEANSGQQPAQRETAGKVDWDAIYQGCKNSDDFTAFWDGDANNDGYWKTEWGDDANQIKSFGKTWIKFLVSEGFSAEDNCFVYFLKQVQAGVLSKKQEFLLKLSDIQADIFQAMLKAYNQNNLQEKVLRLNNECLMEHNLIYYPGFYASLSTDAEKLLELQDSAHGHGIKSAAFRNLFCQDNNIFKLKTTAQITKDLKKAGVGSKEEISNEMAEKLIKDINPAQAKEVLATLYIAYSATNAKALANIKGLTDAINGVQVTPEAAKNILTKFKLNTGKVAYKDETVTLIMKELIKIILGKDPN